MRWLYKILTGELTRLYVGGGSGGGKAPKAPDYIGAANATAAGNLEAAKYATQANRINQHTPYGSLIYSQGPAGSTFDQSGYDAALKIYNQQLDNYNRQSSNVSSRGLTPSIGFLGEQQTRRGAAPIAPDRNSFNRADPAGGQWSSTVNLSPVGQQLLDYSNNSALGLGKLQDTALQSTQSTLSNPFDYGSVQDVQDDAYKSYTSRLDPQWAQNEESQASRLANQGIVQGSRAYDDSMRVFNQGKNDAYQQAITGAINSSPQTLQLAQALRNQPLNELNALRTGSQVTNPTFTPVPQQATTAGADLLGAANGQYQNKLNSYNASQANSGNLLGGLFSLGGAIAGGSSGGLLSGLFA